MAKAQTCTLHISAQTEDITTKDSTGDWRENTSTMKSWEVTSDCLYVQDADATGTLADVLAAAMVQQTKLSLEFSTTNGVQNRTATTDYKRSGSAFVRDFSISSEVRQEVTAQAQFQGTGPLV